MMKRYFLALVLVVLGLVSFAQYQVSSKYFVYLQTEPAQPFYIKIDKQQIKANSSGYLILPQLSTGNYKMTVGFNDGKTQEQVFNFRIDAKDKGYLIKNFGNEGWGLFDLQTMVVQKPMTQEEINAMNKPVYPKETKKEEPVIAKKEVPETPKKEETVPADNINDFTKVLSKATNDPSILEKPKPVEQPVIEKKPETVPVKETVVEKPKETAKPVTDKSEGTIISNDTTGVIVDYEELLDNNKTEKIRIFIPQPAKPVKDVVKQIEETVKQQAAPVIENKQAPVGSRQLKAAPATCANAASEEDFLALRRSMAMQDNDDEMISTANKAFKLKCYTTSQIKYLSAMFLSNAGKFSFFDAAAKVVADPQNYYSLISEIKDNNYAQQFEALFQ